MASWARRHRESVHRYRVKRPATGDPYIAWHARGVVVSTTNQRRVVPCAESVARVLWHRAGQIMKAERLSRHRLHRQPRSDQSATYRCPQIHLQSSLMGGYQAIALASSVATESHQQPYRKRGWKQAHGVSCATNPLQPLILRFAHWSGTRYRASGEITSSPARVTRAMPTKVSSDSRKSVTCPSAKTAAAPPT